MMNAILSYSGGLDSTVLLYDLLNKKYNVQCILFDYNQRHKKELNYAINICKLNNINFRIIDVPNIFGRDNSQTGDIQVPEGNYTEENLKQTVVPGRNLFFISVMTSIAINNKISEIYYAAHAGDYVTYPDCRPYFVNGIQQAVSSCDWFKVNLFVPFLYKSKTEIIKLGNNLNVPFDKTWTCYKDGNLHCGQCSSCKSRKESFKLSNIRDYTIYKCDST